MDYQVEILAPSPIFNPYIEYYKNVVTDSEGEFKCVPTINQELYFNFKKIWLQSDGLYTLQFSRVFFMGLHQYEQDAYSYNMDNERSGGFVIVFKPNGIQNLFRLSNAEIFKYVIDGKNVLGNYGEYLWSKLKKSSDIFEMKIKVEKFLLQFVKPSFVPDPVINLIFELIKKKKGMLSTGQISKSVNISPRSLQRRFRDQFGLAPKEYLQIVRLNHALNMIQNNDEESLTHIGYLSGYYDQAHFIKDVKKICGFSPGTLKKESQHIEKCDNRNFLKLS